MASTDNSVKLDDADRSPLDLRESSEYALNHIELCERRLDLRLKLEAVRKTVARLKPRNSPDESATISALAPWRERARKLRQEHELADRRVMESRQLRMPVLTQFAALDTGDDECAALQRRLLHCLSRSEAEEVLLLMLWKKPDCTVEDRRLHIILSKCWNSWPGAQATRMSEEKLMRIKFALFCHPAIEFYIERHPGEEYAYQLWRIDISPLAMRSGCGPSVRVRDRVTPPELEAYLRRWRLLAPRDRHPTRLSFF